MAEQKELTSNSLFIRRQQLKSFFGILQCLLSVAELVQLTRLINI